MQEESERQEKRREKEEAELKKQIKKQQEEAAREQRRREKEEAERKKQLAMQKQASMMECFLRSKKSSNSSDNSDRLSPMKSQSVGTASKNEGITNAVTSSMDCAFSQQYSVSMEDLCRFIREPLFFLSSLKFSLYFLKFFILWILYNYVSSTELESRIIPYSTSGSTVLKLNAPIVLLIQDLLAVAAEGDSLRLSQMCYYSANIAGCILLAGASWLTGIGLATGVNGVILRWNWSRSLSCKDHTC